LEKKNLTFDEKKVKKKKKESHMEKDRVHIQKQIKFEYQSYSRVPYTELIL
jgi:hypothetical protein